MVEVTYLIALAIVLVALNEVIKNIKRNNRPVLRIQDG